MNKNGPCSNAGAICLKPVYVASYRDAIEFFLRRTLVRLVSLLSNDYLYTLELL
jgi:hypothetical protein